MKLIGKVILWALGIFAWFMFFLITWMGDINNGTYSHLIILIITGSCLAIYIFRKTGSRAKELEKENQELKAEVEKLRAELQDQAVRRAMDKAERQEKKD